MFSDAPDLSNYQSVPSSAGAIRLLKKMYKAQADQIRARFKAFAAGEDLSRLAPQGVYPSLVVEVPSERVPQTAMLAMGQISGPSFHATTITQPALFEDYLKEQLAYIAKRYAGKIYVGLSDVPIPLSFAMETASTPLTRQQKESLQQYFPLPNLIDTNDDIVNGKQILQRSGAHPLSLFTAERIDYSLHRLRHYTATDPASFQPYILLTNYQRYVDEFIETALAEIKAGRAEYLVEPGGRVTGAVGKPSRGLIKKLPQMPAYHLVRKSGGVSLVNIGVGPSNAKTITDHLAVLRPHVWLMIGHCGALRRSQRLGDYVLAHAYLRDDHVLDEMLPVSIPLPTIAEVQMALTGAVLQVTGLEPAQLKSSLRTGTVVTTDDRNWELNFDTIATRLNQARAIAIDMESATVAANGYRYRVPYGTLLCASDRPLHGEIKLPGMADNFYQERVGQHLEIGMQTVELLAKEAKKGSLHSRKLRSFDEPLFR